MFFTVSLWLYEISRGIDHEPVRLRIITQSIGCGKNFNGPEKLKTAQQVMHWLVELSTEIVERLQEDFIEVTSSTMMTLLLVLSFVTCRTRDVLKQLACL